MTAVNGVLWGPISWGVWNQEAALALNNATNLIAVGFVAPKTGTINTIKVRVTASAGVPPDYNVGITTPDANGRPQNVPWPGSAYESVDLAGAGVKTITLASPAAVTVGNYVHAQVRPGGIAPDGINNVTIIRDLTFSGADMPPRNQSYAGAFDNQGGINLGVYYDDGTVAVPGVATYEATPRSTIRQATAVDEAGARFQVPFSAKMVGAALYMGSALALSATFSMRLYDRNQALLEAWAGDFRELDGAFRFIYVVPFTERTLLPNTDYYITVRATNAQDLNLYRIPVFGLADKVWWPNGANWSYVETAAAAPFTETPTTLPYAGLLLSDITLEAQPLISPERPDWGTPFAPELYGTPEGKSPLLYASFFGIHSSEIRLGDRRVWQTYVRR